MKPRSEHKSPEAAIFQACLLRFRPIMMTTMAALLGGLLFSQMLTLYTTPVVYLYLDCLQRWGTQLRQGRTRRALQDA